MIMYARLVWSWVEDEVLCLVVSPLVVLVKHLKHLQDELPSSSILTFDHITLTT